MLPAAGPREHRRARSLLHAAVSVGAWTLVTRLTGFVRLAAIGAVLGPTFLGNLFQTANQLPNLAFELVAGQLIASLLPPILVSHLDRDDRQASERVAGGFLGLIIGVFAATAVVLTLAGPLLTRVLALGVDDGPTRDGYVQLGWPLVAVVMPQLVLYGVIGVANAVQNARHRFGLAAAAPVVENVIVVAALVVFRQRVGAGADVGTVPTVEVVFLGAGCTFGVAVHAALQWIGAWRVGVVLRPRAGWRDPEVVGVARLALPSLGLAALTAAQTFGCLVVVGSVAGGVVAFQLGLAFVATAVALGGRPLTVAALPDLARRAASRDWAGFRAGWDRTLSVTVLLLAPVAAALAVLAPALGRLLGVGAMADEAAVSLLVAALAGLGVAALGEGVTSFANQATYTLGDARSPLQGALVRTLLLTAGLGVALRLDDPFTVVLVTGIAYSVATMLSAWYVTRTTALRLPAGTPLGRQLAESTAAASVAAVPALAISMGVAALGGPLSRFTPAVAGGLALVVGYLGLQQFAAPRVGRPALLERLRPHRTPAEPGSVTSPEHAGVVAPAPPRRQWDGATMAMVRRRAGATLTAAALLGAAVGPATAQGDGRWFLITASTLVVLFAAARPEQAVLAMVTVGPITGVVDLLGGTSITLAMVIAVSAGVLVANVASQAKRAIVWRMRFGVGGWAALLGTGMLAAATGLLADQPATGVRLATILIGTVGSLVGGLRSFAALRRAARLTTVAALVALPLAPLLSMVLGHDGATMDLLGVVAAPASAAVGLSMATVCRRHRVAATHAVLAIAGGLGAGGGWLALIPVTACVWLTVRFWPTNPDPLAPVYQETGATQRPAGTPTATRPPRSITPAG
ncbi:MAG: hypothetical protein IT196_20360 [Acidimicrobiales bacterium]|nr:hypothetical protein [Acidimicrobiales bacterium]